MSLAVLVFITLLVVVLWTKISPLIRQKLRVYNYGEKIPGPRAFPFIGNLAQIPTVDFELSNYFYDLTKKYVAKGETAVRLWFAHNLLFFPLDGKTAKEILDSNDEIDKASDYDFLQPWLREGLLLSTGEKWKIRRRMLTPTFHFAMLDGYVESMDRNARILTDILDGQADTGKEYDISVMVKKCALDIICETAMGIDLNSMSDVDNTYARALERFGILMIQYAYRPWLWSYYLRKLVGFQTEVENLIKTLKTFSEEVIQDRIHSRKTDGLFYETKRKAFLDMMLDMQETHNLTDEDIREQVDNFMVAGHETTSTAVSWTIWALATHPEFQEKVSKEVIDVLGGSTTVTIKDMKEMHYLDLVLKESMRINPPIPLMGRQLKGDLKLGKYSVPGGTNVYVAPLLIHRNPSIYPDPMRFDPERFTIENSKERHAYDYIPFSVGPRNCIGQRFAVYEAKIILAWLIRRFKFTTDMGFSDNVGCPEIVYRPQHGIPVKIHRRE